MSMGDHDWDSDSDTITGSSSCSTTSSISSQSEPHSWKQSLLRLVSHGINSVSKSSTPSTPRSSSKNKHRTPHDIDRKASTPVNAAGSSCDRLVESWHASVSSSLPTSTEIASSSTVPKPMSMPLSQLPPLFPKQNQIYCSNGTLNRRKPPPPPPMRRTSSISNPNAITLGTLRSAGCSTYEEIKTLKRNSQSSTHINYCGNEYENEPIYSNVALETNSDSCQQSNDLDTVAAKAVATNELMQAKADFNAMIASSSNSEIEDDLPLPPPPDYPPADTQQKYSELESSHTGVPKDFLLSLNAKLSVLQCSQTNSRQNRSRSISVNDTRCGSAGGLRYSKQSECSANEHRGHSAGPLVCRDKSNITLPQQSNLYSKEKDMYSSIGTLLKSRKPPPPPPVRRTSSISNPNAITLGTLKSAGCSTYEEIKTLKRNSMSTSSINSCGLGYENEPIYSNTFTETARLTSFENAKAIATVELNKAEHEFNSMIIGYKEKPTVEQDLPPPPSECLNSTASQAYNRITNIRKDFLQTLNAKLSIPQEHRMSPKLTKHRSLSVDGRGERDWNSDSDNLSQTSRSSRISSMSNHSNPLQTPLRVDHCNVPSTFGSIDGRSSNFNRKPYAALTLAACDRESLLQKLNSKLLNDSHQSEVAKAAATVAQKKLNMCSELPPLYHKENQLYCSSGTLTRSRKLPPPPPPIRRTSSISNPNAITMGTLRTSGCSNYEEVRTLKRNSRSINNVEYCGLVSSEPIYSNITKDLVEQIKPIKQSCAMGSNPADLLGCVSRDFNEQSTNNLVRKTICESKRPLAQVIDENQKCESTKDLPPPPPEAYSGDAGPRPAASYNRISNIHREFLQTLNAKLSIPQEHRTSPRLVKCRSMSVGDHEWDSDSGIVTGSSGSAASTISSQSQPHSLQQSLMRLMNHGISSVARPSPASTPPADNKQKSLSLSQKTYTAFSFNWL